MFTEPISVYYATKKKYGHCTGKAHMALCLCIDLCAATGCGGSKDDQQPRFRHGGEGGNVTVTSSTGVNWTEAKVVSK